MSRISSETAVWNQYRQYFSGFPSFLCASTKEMRNTTTKNRIIFVNCKQLPPTHLLCFFSFNIFVFPNTFLPPSFTSSCSSHFFLSILLPLLPSSFQIFFLYFHSYVSHSHILTSPLLISVFPILLFPSLYSSFFSSFMTFLHSLLFHCDLYLFLLHFYSYLYFSSFFSHPLLLPSALCFTLSYPFSNTLILHIVLLSLRFFLRSHSFFFPSPPSILSLLPYANSQRSHDIEKHRFTGDKPLASWFQ